MKTPNFALFGANPVFDRPIPVGQLYFPSWERYESAFRGVFEREYYTNQGPLVQQLEEKLENFLGVKHAICITNATIGLMMVAEALALKGKVILPAFTFIASAQSLTWTGIKPTFCDINLNSHHIDAEKISSLIDNNVSAIMGVNLWGGACDHEALAAVAKKHKLPIYYDSAHSFGCSKGETRIGGYGEAEVFSFHATKILSATEGGCITTNNDELAKRLRNIRSSYGAGPAVTVVKTANGRMSEAQAAIALLSLDDFSINQKNNKNIFDIYEKKLKSIPGIKLIPPSGVSFSNYQYIVCRIDENQFGLTRDILVDILRAENVITRRYFYPGVHRSTPFSEDELHGEKLLLNTDELCATCIQLPVGALLSEQDVVHICDLLFKAYEHADSIHAQYRRKN